MGQELPVVYGVEAQPLKSQAKRVAQALESLGQPLSADEQAKLDGGLAENDNREAVKAIQNLFDTRVLATVNINPESRVKVTAGTCPKRLIEQGWTVFLIKVHNEGGVTAPLNVSSPNAAAMHKRSTGAPRGSGEISAADVADRWMDLQMFNSQPLTPALSGLPVEYRIVQVYSRDTGKREALLAFDVGQGTQDVGSRSGLAILFDCEPAARVTLRVLDERGAPTTASFIFRDARGHVYPARSRRLAPDFFFHDQIYRHDGETVLLPPGTYDVKYGRGPEYVVATQQLEVKPKVAEQTARFDLKRWIRMTDHHWYSGDHHVHAAGCAHYESPAEGVTPDDMMRHILGEDLNVGCVLTWGPCWYHQKRYFEGKSHPRSSKDYLMRYDVEVSGFPSSHAGHLCLLNLTEDDYEYPTEVEFDYSYGNERGHFKGTTTTLIGQWPSWDLPVLQWGQRQGAVVGFSHSGWGLEVPGKELPSFEVPRFDGIGANEYIVDVCHDACDFISAVDTPVIWELSIWYHTLNCGYRCRISGETDFPCIYDDQVGLGRVYVKLNPSAVAKDAQRESGDRSTAGEKRQLDYGQWVQGVKHGRSYVSDGLSHLFDFQANGLEVGTVGATGKISQLDLKSSDELKLAVKAAALLGEQPNEEIRKQDLKDKPYWHVERARVGDSRRVPVELIVNGTAVERREIDADGSIHDLAFSYRPERSCWVAVRIFPSSHTNPIFVEVDGQPIRASRKSAEWCRKGVDVCWEAKRSQIRADELEAAEQAYDLARDAYDRIAKESFDDR
jgi:hypothetical protein